MLVGGAPRTLLVAFTKWSAVLMAWTLTDDVDDIINVRAIISTVHQQDQLRDLIVALEKRLQLGRQLEPKENTDG